MRIHDFPLAILRRNNICLSKVVIKTGIDQRQLVAAGIGDCSAIRIALLRHRRIVTKNGIGNGTDRSAVCNCTAFGSRTGGFNNIILKSHMINAADGTVVDNRLFQIFDVQIGKISIGSGTDNKTADAGNSAFTVNHLDQFSRQRMRIAVDRKIAGGRLRQIASQKNVPGQSCVAARLQSAFQFPFAGNVGGKNRSGQTT